eukprot:760789-Hanusia_phi.AAC.8
MTSPQHEAQPDIQARLKVTRGKGNMTEQLLVLEFRRERLLPLCSHVLLEAVIKNGKMRKRERAREGTRTRTRTRTKTRTKE